MKNPVNSKKPYPKQISHSRHAYVLLTNGIHVKNYKTS